MKKLCLLPVLLIVSHLLFSQTFTEQTGISLTGVYHSSVAWGDYDNDGDLDILLTGDADSKNYISKVYKNNGNNTFTEQTGISLTGVYDGSVAWGDYDNDGYLDILLTGKFDYWSYPISKIYKNNGDNTFTEQTGISLTGVDKSSVAWGDYDNDGDLDILLTGKSDLSYISKIYINNANNTFTEQTGISLPDVRYGSVAWGDYDNDGDLDILLTGYNGYSRTSKIYKNNGNNTFSEQTGISLTGVEDGSVAWGDYDNDGNLDILLTGSTSSSTRISKIYENEGAIVNTPPSIPSNLVQTVNANSATLTWYKATDNETPQDGLSYNLLIQSKIDGKVIKSPLSDSISGIRKVVSIGNVGQNNSWTIKDLTEGVYSWSVQAIDHSYAGSPFAPSKTFVVGNPIALEKPGLPEGATSLCLNPSNSEYQTASVTGATSYSWSISPSNAGVITGDSLTVMVDWSDSFNGTAKISVIALNTTANFGISASSDSLTVVVNTPPSLADVISGDQTVCQGTSDHLYKVAAIAGADSYIWSLPQGAIGTSISDSILVSFGNSATPGTIKVQGQNSCGLGSENSFAVTVNTKPGKPIVTKNGNVLQSSAASGNQWYKQSLLIPGANQKQITSTGDGQYYVVVTESGCSSEPSDVYIITGNETIKLKGLVEVYPNPVSQNLSVISVDNGTSVDYEFVDLLGKVIQKGNFIGKTVIETGSFNPGVYLLKVDNGKTNEIIKIIKE
jgi:predicted nucleotidyltransferase